MLKKVKGIFFLLLLSFAPLVPKAQGRTEVDPATAKAILTKAAITFPKFYHEYEYIKQNDTLIKRIILIKKDTHGGSPAFAAPNGTISIDLDFLESPQPNFDDNRLVVVLYHELGHLHYFLNTPPSQRTFQNSEKTAFEYSLLKTKEMAEHGDCLPLKTGLMFMKLRSEATNLNDPHVRALKLIVTEPMYLGYLKYAEEHCEN